MQWYEEENIRTNQNDSTKKLSKIILIIIVILVILSMAIGGVIVYLNMTTKTITLNGVLNEELNQVFITNQENSNIYIPIRQIAKYFDYEDYSGDYTNLSEDSSKCYVMCKEEVATFTLDSNIIYKYATESSVTTAEAEQIEIDEPVVMIDGNLCTTIEGMEKAFNVSYSQEQNKTTIYTMPFLINYYSERIEKYGYDELIADTLSNSKIILDGMMVVGQNGKVGVVTTSTRENVLEVKYDNVEYLSATSDFLVTSNKKVGIISTNRETKVELTYDSIEKMDSKYNYYLVSKDKKYGVMDTTGKIVVYPDYDKIGIDASEFEENDINSDYIILDDLIPVSQDKLWGMLDAKTGEKVIDIKYDSLGCILSAAKSNSYNILIIPEYEVIVAQKDKEYLLITKTGEELTDSIIDSVYLQESSGNKQYFMEYKESKINVIQLLEQIGIKKKKVEEE